MRSPYVQHGPGRSSARGGDWMRSIKRASHRCGQAGSMPRALRCQDGRTFFADLFGSTALVPSKRSMEGVIGWSDADRSAGTRRVVGPG